MVDVSKLQEIAKDTKILYAEDDKEVQSNTAMILDELFGEVVTADDGKEALSIYKRSDFDIILTDINMPHMNGIELIKNIIIQNPEQIIIVISAHNETEYFIDGIQQGIYGYILKPIDYDQLFDTLWKVVNIVKDRRENETYKKHMEELVEEKTQEIEKNYAKINEMLTLDKVTGLPNNNILYQYLELYAQGNITVYMFKIDNFTLFDQSLEPEAMDRLIKYTAQFIKVNLPNDTQLYRYADDEFVVVLQCSDMNYLTSLPKQINAFLKETPVGVSKSNKDIYITLSTALVVDHKPVNIMQKVRAVISEMKRQELVGQFRSYDENSPYIKGLKGQSQWFEKLREIIEQGKLVPYFHPIIDNTTQKVAKYECLARIEDDGEVISPFHFIDAAKRTGLICSLTRVMINKCFSFFKNSSLGFSINLTNEDLMDESFVDFVLAKQKYFGINPANVYFEILEEILFDENNKDAINTLNVLKRHGFKLSLDDFGADRSNFSRLTTSLKVDCIKLDGQFVKDIHKNEKNQQIVSSIAQLAKNFNIVSIAEFVSCEEEFQIINSLGIDYSQGYYFFKPEKTLH